MNLDYESVLKYINDYWPRIIRYHPEDHGTLIGLPHPYLVPSHGAMFEEMYYWDSYFMALGLVETSHQHLILSIAENLAYLFERFGIIPNGSRYYFTSRSQPPLFTRLIGLTYEVKLSLRDPDADSFLKKMMKLAEHEHEVVWMGEEQPHHRNVLKGLSRYYDINYLDDLAGAESGWDQSTRCDGRWLDHLPVDLNAILYVRELDFARAAEKLGEQSRTTYWQQRASARAEEICELMWDEQEGFFFDYDYKNKQRNVKHPSLAGFYPLWAGLAKREQAERVVGQWLPRFEKEGGLVTTLIAQPGKQWAYPNGWAPLQWLIVEGLELYGYTDEAQRIRRKWCDNCAAVYENTGAMWEKYNVVKIGAPTEPGLYESPKGFGVEGFGWSNAVFNVFARRLLDQNSPPHNSQYG